MNYLYLIVNLGAFIVPFLFSFHSKLLFYKKWKSVLPAILISALLFIVWDIYYTHLGVWGFNPKYLSGLYLYNLPLEEILFFICIPYSCLFTYHCLNLLIKKDYFKKYENSISIIIVLMLMLLGIIFYDRIYTSVTFFLLIVFILFIKYFLKVTYLGRFYFTYMILLIPFLIVNGILTGTGLEEPIVWYNSKEIIGFRILSIPFEDVFYGMLLIILNVSLYESFQRKNISIKKN